MVRIRFLCKEENYEFMICKKNVGFFDPRIRSFYFVNVYMYIYMMVVPPLMSAEILKSACEKILNLLILASFCWCLGVIAKELRQF